MIREKILYIAYSACTGGSLLWKQNPFQYKSAINLIVINFLMHICQVFALLSKMFSMSIKSFEFTLYFILIGSFILCHFIFEKIFSKKILAKSKKIYADSNIGKYCKPIAFGYLTINILILGIIKSLF